MRLELQRNATVRTNDGIEVGTVRRFVVHPGLRVVTHVVISGGRLSFDRIVAVDQVAGASGDEVRLLPGVDPESLVPFEVEHYVDLDEATTGDEYPGAVEAPVVWSYPHQTGLLPSGAESVGADRDGAAERKAAEPETAEPKVRSIEPRYPAGHQRIIERHVAPDARVVATGTPVCSLDGEKLGKVVAVMTDPEGSVSAITVDPGWFRSEQVIGEQFIDSISDDRIALAVTAETIRQLEDRPDPASTRPRNPPTETQSDQRTR